MVETATADTGSIIRIKADKYALMLLMERLSIHIASVVPSIALKRMENRT